MIPNDLLQDPDEPFSLVRDELPFMDTDIARGAVVLSLESFAFFCQEFGLYRPPEPLPFAFEASARYVALHFTELGGDHLDRLMSVEQVEKELHEVLLGSMRLLKETKRAAFFLNCATLFRGST